MKIAVASDGRGDSLRRALLAGLAAQGHELVDRGVYPAGGVEACLDASNAIRTGLVERVILVSSSAFAASLIANRVDGIHAGVCTDTYDARRGGENGMNLMCLGTDLTAKEAAAIVRAFVGARVDVRATLARAVSQPRAVVAA